ncbi:MAG: hypothetical protein IT355_14585 [Gemmatimonadaceae bacterium]|nr:hypothetical protein [Gemmatimonadaceae bacterium]
MATVVRAGVVTGVSDFLWACALSVGVYGSTFAQLWQGVASVPLGVAARDGGVATVVAGIALHFCVALAWTTLFVLLCRALPALQQAIRSLPGALAVAAVYGPMIWAAMSLLVIPLFTHRPPTVALRWWIQLAGHFVFVGAPLVLTVRQAGDRGALSP